MKLAFTVEQTQAILNYLQNKPYKEVFHLIEIITKAEQIDDNEKIEKELR